MQKYTAIIISSREANEYDRVYFLYTREIGMIRVTGKGVRKPAAKLAGHLEPGTLSEVYVARARGMGQITGAAAVENFESVKKDFARLGEALAIFRFFVKNFAEEEKDERIFDLLRDFLDIFDREDRGNGDDWGGILVEAFWWKLFDFLGTRPEVMRCAVCRRRLVGGAKKFFSVEKGGAVCAGCRPDFKGLFLISDNQIKLLRIFWGNPLEKIAKVKISPEELGKLAKIRKGFEEYNF